MKLFLSLLIIGTGTISFSANAIGLESFYGRSTQRGHVYTCTYENNTGSAQSMKYVVFNFDPISGDNAAYDVQDRIDQVVQPGETIRATTHNTNGRINHCKYLARR